MTAAEPSTVEVTVEYAANRLAAGLREYAACETLGCGINGHIRGTAAEQRTQAAIARRTAAGLATELESAVSDDARLAVIRRHGNLMSNMDPRGVFLGSWANTANLVACGRRHVLSDGVLCEKVF